MTPAFSLDTDQLHQLMPLTATLGMRLDAAAPESVRLQLDWRPDLCTSADVLHGGA